MAEPLNDPARIHKLELASSHHYRRADDHERRIVDGENKMKMLLEWKTTIEESTEATREMVELLRALLKLLGWVGFASKWIASVGVACGIVWAGVKALMHLGEK